MIYVLLILLGAAVAYIFWQQQKLNAGKAIVMKLHHETFDGSKPGNLYDATNELWAWASLPKKGPLKGNVHSPPGGAKTPGVRKV